MTMIAYAFLQSRRLKQAKREKKEATARHPSRPFRLSAQPSSPPSNGNHQPGVRTATDGSVLKFCQSSAKPLESASDQATSPRPSQKGEAALFTCGVAPLSDVAYPFSRIAAISSPVTLLLPVITTFAVRNGYDLRRIALLGWREAQCNSRLRATMQTYYAAFRENLSRLATGWAPAPSPSDADAIANCYCRFCSDPSSNPRLWKTRARKTSRMIYPFLLDNRTLFSSTTFKKRSTYVDSNISIVIYDEKLTREGGNEYSSDHFTHNCVFWISQINGGVEFADSASRCASDGRICDNALKSYPRSVEHLTDSIIVI